jgi:NADH:ubiquinone oxidoreductase subunit 2 (subunit N)
LSQPSPVANAGLEPPESVRPYLLVLLVAVALDVLLRLRILDHYLQGMSKPDAVLDLIRNALMGSFLGLFLLFLAQLIRVFADKGRRQQAIQRRQLRPLAMVASALTLVNMVSENLAIYRLKLESYSLMFESLVL